VDSIEIAKQVELIVLGIHRRNGGTLARLNRELRLLDSSLEMDSLDLAEIVVELEKRYNYRPFNSPKPPQTWGEVIDGIVQTVGRSSC